MGTLQMEQRHLTLYRRAAIVTDLSAALSLAVGLLPLPAIPLLMILALLMLLPVFYGFKVWVFALGAEEIQIG